MWLRYIIMPPLFIYLFMFFYSRPNKIISYLRISAGNLKTSHRDAESLSVIFHDAAWLAIKWILNVLVIALIA